VIERAPRAPRRRTRDPLPAPLLPLVHRAARARPRALARRLQVALQQVDSFAQVRELLGDAVAAALTPDRSPRRLSSRAANGPLYCARRRIGTHAGLGPRIRGATTAKRHRDMPKDIILTPEGLEKLQSSSTSSRPRSGARSPSASRRRASSATSPRTPSTTTPRTSRRCSRRGSRVAGEAADGDRDRGRRHLDRHRPGRLGRPRQGREDRQVGPGTRSSARPRPSRRRTSSPTSRRSAARCSATSATRPSRSRCRAVRRASKIKITKIDVGLK
jgi:hypothetical protein